MMETVFFFTVLLTSKSCVFLLPTTNTSADTLQFDLNTAAARSHWEITHRLLSIQSAFPPHCPLHHPSHSQQTKGLRCAHHLATQWGSSQLFCVHHYFLLPSGLLVISGLSQRTLLGMQMKRQIQICGEHSKSPRNKNV